MNQISIEQELNLATTTSHNTIVRIVDHKMSQFQNQSIKDGEFMIQDSSNAYFTSKLTNNKTLPANHHGKLFHTTVGLEQDARDDLVILEGMVPAKLTHILEFHGLNIINILPEAEKDWIFHQVDNIKSTALGSLARELKVLRSAMREDYTFSIASSNFTGDIDNIITTIDRLDFKDRNAKDLLLLGAYIYFIFRSYYQTIEDGKVYEFNNAELGYVKEALEKFSLENKNLCIKLNEFADAGAQADKPHRQIQPYSKAVALVIDLHCLFAPEWKIKFRRINEL
jgi:hypothetical protein